MDKSPKPLAPDDVLAYASVLASKSQAAKSIVRAIRARAKAFFTFIHQQGIVPISPATEISTRKFKNALAKHQSRNY